MPCTRVLVVIGYLIYTLIKEYIKGEAYMREENLKLAQQDIEDALKTVEDLEQNIDSDALSKDDIKERFISLSDKLQKLEDILKNEGIL